MNIYNVEFTSRITYGLDIAANSEEEAITLAKQICEDAMENVTEFVLVREKREACCITKVLEEVKKK